MAVRKQCNRYRTPPSGTDFDNVLKRGKTFYRSYGEFEMTPWGDRWTAERPTVSPFKMLEGTIVYKWNYKDKKWQIIPTT